MTVPESAITTLNATHAERAAVRWTAEVADDIGRRLLRAKATRGPYLQARGVVIAALDRGDEYPPAEFDRLLPPLDAPEWSPEPGAGTSVVSVVAAGLRAPAAPRGGFRAGVDSGRVGNGAPRASGAAQTVDDPGPRPKDARTATEAFADLPAAERRRWCAEVERAACGALDAKAVEVTAAARWRAAVKAGVVVSAGGRA